ncbi:MAG: phosphoribosylanthranilate isomerase [Hyphomicrobiales bacterium]
MSVIVKICGLKTVEALSAALDARADMVGFVFFPRSPRHVDIDQAATLSALTGIRSKKVALTVDASDEALSAIINALKPDLLQLHGHETPERTAEIRSRFGIPVMKALGVASVADLFNVKAYEQVADHLLFDAKPPRNAALPGGNGLIFDWQILSDLDLAKPFMVSGGLDPSNVATALVMTGARGVDVSSGVETAPGIKDPARITAFIDAAKRVHPHGTQRNQEDQVS